MIKKLALIIIFIVTGCTSIKRQPNNQADALLRFTTDDNYLVIFMLVNTAQSRISNKLFSQDILSFQNRIWSEKKSEYEILLSNIKSSQLTYLNFKKRIEPNYSSLIDYSKNTPEFKVLKNQTDIYKQKVEKIWIDYFLKTKLIISNITGLELLNGHNVIITHPAIKNGKEVKGQWIEWGGYDEPNYVVTNLWHEILHNYFDKSNLSHSVIELIANHELNKILTQFEYPPLVGHKQLRLIENCLMDDWKNYLLQEDKDIMIFINANSSIKCGNLFTSLDW
jgi:hypothetical protein